MMGILCSHSIPPAYKLKHGQLWSSYSSSRCPGGYVRHRMLASTPWVSFVALALKHLCFEEVPRWCWYWDRAYNQMFYKQHPLPLLSHLYSYILRRLALLSKMDTSLMSSFSRGGNPNSEKYFPLVTVNWQNLEDFLKIEDDLHL